LCEEPSAENEYLEDFYQDKAAHAFGCQVAFLAARFSQNLRVMSGLAEEQKGVVQDRGPYEDVIFARMLHESGDIDDRDYRTYTSLFETLVSNLGENIPDVVIFLDVDVDVLVRRVDTRGRDCEKDGGVTRDYLAQLALQYERFVEDMGTRTSVFRIKWDEFRETADVWDAVLKQYDGTPGVTTLDL
jgi:deoxyadenosine/deoxycytidine kinase